MTTKFLEGLLLSMAMAACGNVDVAAPPPSVIDNVAGMSAVQTTTQPDATGGSSNTSQTITGGSTNAPTSTASSTGGNTWEATTLPTTGGQQATGGSSSISTTQATGGTKTTGGSPATGGTPATGGKSNQGTGGAKTTGGSFGTGGALGTGGNATCLDVAKQGCEGLIGNPADYQICLNTYGCPDAGTGGASNTGGASTTGGNQGTGGALTTGGKSSTGGASQGTGGSTLVEAEYNACISACYAWGGSCEIDPLHASCANCQTSCCTEYYGAHGAVSC